MTASADGRDGGKPTVAAKTTKDAHAPMVNRTPR